jgi:hypothetical protein
MGRRFNRQARKTGLSERAQNLRLADFPVGSLQSRASARALLLQQQKRFQLIFYVEGEPLNLERSTCERRIWPDGTLFDLVMFHGDDTDLAEGQREAFIQQHPIVDK